MKRRKKRLRVSLRGRAFDYIGCLAETKDRKTSSLEINFGAWPDLNGPKKSDT
jgi:hypothetical protein